MKLIFIHGPIASGKHTIGTILSKKTGIPLFHNHLTVDLASSLFPFGSEPFIKLREQIWLSSFQIAMEADQSMIFTFAPEKTVSSSFISKTQEILEEGEIYFIELSCSEKEIICRLSNKNRRKFGKLTDENVYKDLKVKGFFDFPELPEPFLKVNTSEIAPEEAAEIIYNKLKEIPQ